MTTTGDIEPVFTTYTIPEGLDVHTVRKRPTLAQTVLATTDNMALIADWINDNGHAATLGEGQVIIQTLEGPFTVRPGTQVICGTQGEFSAHEGGEFFKQAYDDLGLVAR